LQARQAAAARAWQGFRRFYANCNALRPDDLALAVTQPKRIVALALVMVLRLLVYRLAEHRLREQLAATGQTIPSQVNKPTQRPTMRWVF